MFFVLFLGEGLQKVSNDIKSELEKVSKNIGSNTNKYTNIADNYLAEYGPYRFYLGIGVCSILLLVSFFSFLKVMYIQYTNIYRTVVTLGHRYMMKMT